MLISSEDIGQATTNALIVGHESWSQALILERLEGNIIDDPRLIDGIWVYPLTDKLKLRGSTHSTLDLQAGDWTVLRGAYCNGEQVQTRDCPGVRLSLTMKIT
jgi:hypothetical protein